MRSLGLPSVIPRSLRSLVPEPFSSVSPPAPSLYQPKERKMSSLTVASRSFKPLKMALHPLRLTSHRSIFILSIPTRSHSLQLSLTPKNHFPSIVSRVAAIPVEAGGQDEEPTWENRLDGADSAVDWDPDGEDSAVEASGAEGVREFEEPSEDAKLFVGNLPYDVDSQGLAMLFEQAGTVEIAEVIYSRETDRSRGFGFVIMSTVEEAEKAVEKLHRYELNGRPLTVNKATARGSRTERPPHVYEPAYRIYVGNLQWDVDGAQLEQIFSKHGKVLEARVVYDRDSGRSRGFGFVTMSSESEMNDAIAALDGQDLEGRTIRVNAAQERPRRG